MVVLISSMEEPAIEYSLTRSHRKTIAIHISKIGDVEVRAPLFTPKFLITRFVLSKREWILDAKRRVVPVKKYSFVEGERFPYLGQPLALHLCPARFPARAGTILLFPKHLVRNGTAHMEEWYRKEAKSVLAKKTALFAKKIGASYSAVSIRDTASRWGSCSSSGRISYCWRLLLADEGIVDYVVIHEVCHRIHPDHSHAFWDTVGRYDPNYRVHRTWLKRYGHTLTLS